MKTIRYEILQDNGLKAVAGEPVEIANDQGMSFGLHCNVYRRFDDELRYVVTHIESGMLVGSGAVRCVAIENARTQIDKARLRGTLAYSVESAMRARAEAVSAFAHDQA